MNKKIMAVVFVFALMAQGLSGCCNRCKNQPGPTSVIPASSMAGQDQSYAPSAVDQSSTYTARQAIK